MELLIPKLPQGLFEQSLFNILPTTFDIATVSVGGIYSTNSISCTFWYDGIFGIVGDEETAFVTALRFAPLSLSVSEAMVTGLSRCVGVYYNIIIHTYVNARRVTQRLWIQNYAMKYSYVVVVCY